MKPLLVFTIVDFGIFVLYVMLAVWHAIRRMIGLLAGKIDLDFPLGMVDRFYISRREEHAAPWPAFVQRRFVRAIGHARAPQAGKYR